MNICECFSYPYEYAYFTYSYLGRSRGPIIYVTVLDRNETIKPCKINELRLVEKCYLQNVFKNHI